MTCSVLSKYVLVSEEELDLSQVTCCRHDRGSHILNPPALWGWLHFRKLYLEKLSKFWDASSRAFVSMSCYSLTMRKFSMCRHVCTLIPRKKTESFNMYLVIHISSFIPYVLLKRILSRIRSSYIWMANEMRLNPFANAVSLYLFFLSTCLNVLYWLENVTKIPKAMYILFSESKGPVE